VQEFEANYDAPATHAFRRKVTMTLDPEVDAAYPQRWIGKITVTTVAGEMLSERVDEPKGDPGNTLTRPELEDKARRLAAFSGAATAEELQQLIATAWGMRDLPAVAPLLGNVHE
jgi:2-methylcitrate dehydratase PrpD